jgi:type II secretory pathway component PulF
MRISPLRAELQTLEASLAKGTPLREAIQTSRLPDLYQNLLLVGVQSNNLPGVLTLAADYYQRRHTIWTRLKGLMVYPAIVLTGAFALACFMAYILYAVVWPVVEGVVNQKQTPLVMALWLAPVILGLAVIAALIAFASPGIRHALRWRLPAFRESSLAQVASAMSLMLRSGVPLDTALGLVQRLEQGTPAGIEVGGWRHHLALGKKKFDELASPGRAFPPLFIWLVARAGEDMATGFQRAADIYKDRAAYRAEVLLYSALPVSLLALGAVVVSEIQPVMHVLAQFMQMIGDTGA